MLQNEYDVIIIGAGPAGLIAAIECYKPSRKILILEKMYQPALKLRLCGKGRCNITNVADLDDFLSHFGKNGRFLKYAFAEFFNNDLLKYFEKLGVKCKLERGGRYFPQKDDAMEVVMALLNKVKSLNIAIATHSDVTGITKSPNNKFVISLNSQKLTANQDHRNSDLIADKVILATGGKSYPKTGSDGSGYKIGSMLGHTITPVLPSLVPLETSGSDAKKLQGLSLRNVNVRVWCDNKKVDELFGEMLFTKFGVDGPVILSLSRTIAKLISNKQKVIITIDLKPALDHKKLDKRLLREISELSRQNFKSLLKNLIPAKLIPVFIEKLAIPEDKLLSQINSEERKKLRLLLKEFRFEITGCRSYDRAIVTSGGISIKEIHPHTMESKLVEGLFFAGEIIDIDADTGGFNLQAAFSTGWIAGRAV